MFPPCYDAYRRLCLEFKPKSLPESSAIYDLLSVGIKEGTKLSGIPIFDYWARGKYPKTVRRVRNEIAKRRTATFDLDWGKLLPGNLTEFRMLDYHEPNPF